VKKIFELPAEITGGDPVIVFLQSQEIRSYMRTLPVVDRIKLALSSDDPALLHALDTCSPCLQLIPDEIKKRSYEYRVKRRRGADLRKAEDERVALQQVTSVLRNIPGTTCTFLHISPGLHPLPDSVYPDGKDREFDDDATDEEINRLSKEIGAALTAAMVAQTP
jgi:hypothetical protein